MKSKLGVVCIVLGALLLASSMGLHIHNLSEEKAAGESANALMPLLVEMIQQQKENADEAVLAAVVSKELPVREIDGYDYIGFVGIPALNRELPVMADWSYPQLKIAPCRFSGSTNSSDMVIMAHNYDDHFGGLHQLRAGDTVTFTDMDGVTTQYEVMALDVLAPTAVEEMTSGEYDLTLFTCTYGGQSRVTVRCDRVAILPG